MKFEAHFVNENDGLIDFISLDAEDWASALKEAAGLDIPAGTVKVEVIAEEDVM